MKAAFKEVIEHSNFFWESRHKRRKTSDLIVYSVCLKAATDFKLVITVKCLCVMSAVCRN